MTPSDPSATSSLIRQSYDAASQFYPFQSSDPLLNMCGTDLHVSGMVAGLSGASTSKPKPRSQPRGDSADKEGNINMEDDAGSD